MQERNPYNYVDSEMKQIEITAEAHKALKLEAADRGMPMKSLANGIIEDWLDSHRPGWRKSQKNDDSPQD